jgi:uncharacterized membrane protein
MNVLVHSRDAWTSVVPQGLGLSVIVTILLLVTAIYRWTVTTARGAPRGDRA